MARQRLFKCDGMLFVTCLHNAKKTTSTVLRLCVVLITGNIRVFMTFLNNT